MTLPLGDQYQIEIQNPRLCLDNAELQACQPVTDRLGLPKLVSGSSAVAFQLVGSGRRFAVRCFTRLEADQEERYAAISACVGGLKRSYFVPFTYLGRGIRAQGVWYPILKMEWVHGDPLDIYVEKNLGSSARLRSLAGQFLDVAADLRRLGIAHGDLQHGNILIRDGRIVLIDYDGMYVPALAGRCSHERGQLNYQHPRRSARDFGPYLDNFSEWVIYTSLVAVSVQPSLWGLLRGGDDCLLLRQSDLDEPGASPAFSALLNSPDAIVRRAAGVVVDSLKLQPQQVPELDSSLLRAGGARSSGSMPEWLAEYMRADAARSAAEAPAEPANGPAAPQRGVPRVPMRPVQFHGPAGFDRVVVAASVLEGIALVLAAGAAAAVASVFVVLVVGLAILLVASLIAIAARYRRLPEVLARGETAAVARQMERELSRMNRRERALGESISAVVRTMNAEGARALSRLQKDYLQRQLRAHSLAGANVRGVGPVIVSRLAACGILTAGDVSYGRVIGVSGVGQTKARALVQWREGIAKAAQGAFPTTLPPPDEAGIRRRFEIALRERGTQRQHLIAELAALDRKVSEARADAELDRERYAQITFAGYLRWVWAG